MRLGKTLIVLAIVLVVVLAGSFLLGMAAYFLAGEGSVSDLGIGGRVGIVTVEGMLTSSEQILEDMEEFKKDDDVKAVVLRINSPGGPVGVAQEIFEAAGVLAKEKPVVASMGTIAASGGYYVACGATKIFANAGTTTGSIGVRLEHLSAGDLMKWAKLNHETLKSGKLKDLLPIDKPISPEAREILQGVLDDIHRQFKEVVSKARGIDPARVDEIADGRIFTGEQAKALGLVDNIGGFTLAINEAGKLGGIKGVPKTVKPKRERRFFARILEEAKLHLNLTSGDYLQPMFLMNVF